MDTDTLMKCATEFACKMAELHRNVLSFYELTEFALECYKQFIDNHLNIKG